MGKSLLFAISVLAASTATPAMAQIALAPFTLSVQQGQSVTPVANGQTLAVTATGVGQKTTFTLTGVYTGTNTAIFSSEAQLVGSPDFTIGHISPAVPLNLGLGQGFKLDITFNPSSSAIVAAQLIIPFSISVPPVVAGGTPTITTGSLAFALSGGTANMTVNYFSAPSNNIIPLSNGGTIPFPSTLVNTSVSVTVVVANAGSATGLLKAVSLTGTNNNFQLQGVGLLPAAVGAGTAFSFNILYYPGVVGNDTGTLTLELATGTFTVNLTGTSVSPSLVYQLTNGTTTSALTVGQPIVLPDTNVGSTTSVTIQVQNNGTALATINNIATTGSAFSVSDLPILPINVTPSSSTSFTLNFSPTTAATASGTLTIGGTRFTVTGKGLGSQLSYSYGGGSGTSVISGGTVLFPSVPVAQSISVPMTVTSSGTTPATITSIGIPSGAAASSYSISNLPTLPTTLAPGASLNFTITFTPQLAGLNSATLLINTASFVLSGFASSVPALPSYQITGASGQIQPFTQPSVGLTLSKGYPLDVTGVLTLAVSSTVFASDPAVQFATGGRTISFTIPANTTQAVFSNGSQSIQFQSGTVAESISLSATFATNGGANITPSGSNSLSLTVPQLAPTVMSVQISSVTSNSITVLVEGYSTTRSLSKLTFQFSSLSPTTFNFTTTSFTVDVSQNSGFWYSSAASQTFGGEFAISYPFSIQVNNPSGTTAPTLAGNIGVAVTASNSIGTSSSVSGQ